MRLLARKFASNLAKMHPTKYCYILVPLFARFRIFVAEERVDVMQNNEIRVRR